MLFGRSTLPSQASPRRTLVDPKLPELRIHLFGLQPGRHANDDETPNRASSGNSAGPDLARQDRAQIGPNGSVRPAINPAFASPTRGVAIHPEEQLANSATASTSYTDSAERSEGQLTTSSLWRDRNRPTTSDAEEVRAAARRAAACSSTAALPKKYELSTFMVRHIYPGNHSAMLCSTRSPRPT